MIILRVLRILRAGRAVREAVKPDAKPFPIPIPKTGATPMASYSKLLATVIAAIVSWAVYRFALPAEWADPNGEVIIGLTGLVTAILVYIFPANKPS